MCQNPNWADAGESILRAADTFAGMFIWGLQVPPSFHAWQAYEASWVQLALWLDCLSSFSGNAASLRVLKHENISYSFTM